MNSQSKPARFSTLICCLSLVFCCSTLYGASEILKETLPLEIQVDLLIEELSTKREARDHHGVIDVIARIRALNAPFPDFLYWVEAQSLNETGQTLATRDRLLVYLSKAGRDGRFYQQASELLVLISPEAERLEAKQETMRKQRAHEIAAAEQKARVLRTQNAQRLLDQLGFPVDESGELDQQTREAVAIYQIRRNLAVNANITDEVIDLLNSEVPDKHTCDDLAHYSTGPDDWINIDLDEMNAIHAVSECNNALRDYPDVVRFQIQYARALAAADRGEEAVLSVTDVARKGYPAAEYLIGELHFRGQLSDSGKPDYKNALRSFNFAAGRKYAYAQYRLGQLYEKGPGVTKDSRQAFNWYLKAAEQGFAPAQVEAAGLLVSGRGISKNLASAMKWYQRAADQGFAEGMFGLAEMYERGRGVTKDKLAAIEWYSKAARLGHLEANEKLKRLKR